MASAGVIVSQMDGKRDKIGFGQFEIAKAIGMKIQSDFEPRASGLKL